MKVLPLAGWTVTSYDNELSEKKTGYNSTMHSVYLNAVPKLEFLHLEATGSVIRGSLELLFVDETKKDFHFTLYAYIFHNLQYARIPINIPLFNIPVVPYVKLEKKKIIVSLVCAPWRLFWLDYFYKWIKDGLTSPWLIGWSTTPLMILHARSHLAWQIQLFPSERNEMCFCSTVESPWISKLLLLQM